jgi:hypothetical protein
LRPGNLTIAFVVILFCLVAAVVIAGGFSALSIMGRIAFVLFLPGFAILQALVPEHFDLGEKVILSFIIGFAYSSLTALYFSFLKVAINAYTVVLSVLLLSVPLLVYSWRKGTFMSSLKAPIKSSSYIILILLLVVSVIFLSMPWSDNGIVFPIGDDPATSTLAATLIAQQGKIPQSWAPYFPDQSTFAYSPAYPSVTAFLYLLDTSISIPVIATYFLAFFAIINAEVFVLIKRIFNNERVALVAAAFTALGSLSFYMMAQNGRYPALIGTALTLSLILFTYLYANTGSRKLLLLAAISFAGTFLAYSVSFITSLIFVLCFFIFKLIFSDKKKQTVLGATGLLGVGIALCLPWVANIVSRLSMKTPPREVDALITWFGGATVKAQFGASNILSYYGYWVLLIGILGVLVYFIKAKGARILLAWFLSTIVLLANEIFLIRFPGWYYLQTAAFINPLVSFILLVLLGVGVAKGFLLLRNKKFFSGHKYRSRFFSLIFVILLLASIGVGANRVVEHLGHNTNRIPAADMHALTWLSENTPQDSVIYTDHWVGVGSIWIPVISHRQVTMALLSISEVGWSDSMFTRQDESLIVTKDPNSTEALNILYQYNASYIYLSDHYSQQVEAWRNNYNVTKFQESNHYQVVFQEQNAVIIKISY